MPHKAWKPGEEVMAAELNMYVQNQVVATYLSAADRASSNPTPVTGQCSTRADLPGGIEVYNGSIWVAAGVGWQSYNPVWSTFGTGAVQPSIGNGTLTGRYTYLGHKMCFVFIDLSSGTTTDGGRMNMAFSLPNPSHSTLRYPLTVGLGQGSVAYSGYGYAALADAQPGGPLSPTSPQSTSLRNADATGAVGTGVPQIAGSLSWTGSGRFIRISGIYELA